MPLKRIVIINIYIYIYLFNNIIIIYIYLKNKYCTVARSFFITYVYISLSRLRTAFAIESSYKKNQEVSIRFLFQGTSARTMKHERIIM